MSTFYLQDDAQRYWPRTAGSMLTSKLGAARPFATRDAAEQQRDTIHRRNGGKGPFPWRVIEVLTVEERNEGLVAAMWDARHLLEQPESRKSEIDQMLAEALRKFGV